MNRVGVARSRGFTIVELLIVIVVIAVLAVITVVAFNGLKQRAVEASIKADLAKAQRAIMLYHADGEVYPTGINCGATQTDICVRPSSGNTYNYSADNGATPPAYTLSVTNGNKVYRLSDGNTLVEAQGVVTSGLTAYLDAGNPSSYSGAGTTWNSLSGGGSASLSGSTYSMANGGTLIFDGVSSYAKVSSVTAQSILMFVYIDTQATNWRYFIDSRPGNGGGYLANQQIGDWSNFYVNGSPVASAWGSIPKDQWLAFYAENASPSTSTINLMSRYSNNEFLMGKLGVVLVYGRKLTPAEILQNYNFFKSRYGM